MGLYSVFDISVSGLFCSDYIDAPWSMARVWAMLKRIWFPMLIIGMSGTAGLIRVMRGNLLDELQKQYVITARAKGVPERQVLFRYPVRIAVNPIISTIGWILPSIVGGEVLVSIVLIIGGVSGYFGGVADMIIQRTIEFILSLPIIPLWMALSAALPQDWPVVRTYFFITIILSFMSWGTLARQVRGKLLSLREEDYVVSAWLVGSGEARIMAVHLFPALPSTASNLLERIRQWSEHLSVTP